MLEIETKDVYLRPFKQSDLEDIFLYASVVGVGENAGWKHHTSKEESQAVLYNHFLVDPNTFAIVEKKTNHVIGSFSLIERTTRKSDFPNLHTIEIGYVLSKDYWNRGIMSRLLFQASKAIFEGGMADVLIICCHDHNVASQKVALKNGFELYKTIEDVYHPILDEKRTIYCYCKRKQVEAI